MGAKMAQIYATLFLGFLERKLYSTICMTYNNYYDIMIYFKNLYFSYLDDVFIICDEKISFDRIEYLLNN